MCPRGGLDWDGKGKATPSGARSGLASWGFSAIRRIGPAIHFGRNANLINGNSAIRESRPIAEREKKAVG